MCNIHQPRLALSPRYLCLSNFSAAVARDIEREAMWVNVLVAQDLNRFAPSTHPRRRRCPGRLQHSKVAS